MPDPSTRRTSLAPRRYRIVVSDVTEATAMHEFAPIFVSSAGTVASALMAAAAMPPSTWAGDYRAQAHERGRRR